MAGPNNQDLILNAAKACYLRLGIAKTTAADIAAEAGLSRATLYRRFPSHEDIFVSVLERESLELARDNQRRLGKITDPCVRIVEGMLFCLDEMPRRPLHAHLLQGNSQWAISQAMPAARLHRISLDMLTGLLDATESQTAESCRHLDDLAEWLLRALTSYAMVPSQRARNRDEMRRFLHAMLDPTIKAVLGEPPVAKKIQQKKSGGKKS